ncbi:MAG: YifB family Mg chelatase-like AAA ATPase [Bacteroidaceae bacterium]|nr:YifB family Mg chelatase-like AAA ATPase [Bacteroidaceae bacterium]
MLATVHTAALNGLTAMHVFIETSMRRASGDATFFMVGLPDSAVRESRTRVMAALQSISVNLPPNINVDINFAPADVRKEGTGYDLPLAIALMAAHNLITHDSLGRTMLVGELGLDGSLRPVRGALPIAIKARELGYEQLILPLTNAREAAVVNRLRVFGAERLGDVISHLNGVRSLPQTEVDTRAEFFAAQGVYSNDFAEVKGQQTVKRAMEVAAAGGHNILLIGSPGCGKSMIAKRFPSILPPLTLAESLETTQIHSIAGKLSSTDTLIKARPFRSPHHTVSDVALIGGGANFQPGEISLSHNGVLFLDEFPEYSRSVLETLRQPLEDRIIQVSRAKYSITLPCSFQLVAAMNPCPCGHYNDPHHDCTCTPAQIQRYMNKISGPLLDRIDLQVEVLPVPLQDLATAPAGESSATIRERVIRARAVQSARFEGEKGIHCNAQMNTRLLTKYAQPTPEAMDYLTFAMDRLKLSARAYERVLKVARTIADLAASADITKLHIAEALSYRNLDRSTWGE